MVLLQSFLPGYKNIGNVSIESSLTQRLQFLQEKSKGFFITTPKCFPEATHDSLGFLMEVLIYFKILVKKSLSGR